MLTVDDYARIPLAHRKGMGIRELARRFHHSRRKIRDVLTCPQPRPYTRTQPFESPKLGPFHELIDEILLTVEQQPVKLRHTAARIFR